MARLGLMALPVAFFGVFFAWPVAAIVARLRRELDESLARLERVAASSPRT